MNDWETLTPLLVYIQANLDQDLALAALGRRANLSPYHLQRACSRPQLERRRTRLINIRPAHVAFRRHVGPYEDVPESLFDELERWAARRRLRHPRIAGIGHDAPIATPAGQLRFDAALVVPCHFAPSGLIGYQLVAGGPHAVTTHAGPYETLSAAYAKIFPRLAAFREYDPVGLPALEVYHAAMISVRFALNHTDCLPMRRKSVA